MTKKIEMIGKKLWHLTVLAEAGRNKRQQVLWKCLCDCGNYTVVSGVMLRRGQTKSCGCLVSIATSRANKTHGLTGTRIYTTWAAMLARCNKPTATSYPRYGAVGVTICDSWKSFDCFYADVAHLYKDGMQIDRIDNNGNYEPGNVRWVTPKQNIRNSTVVKLDEQEVGAIKSLFLLGVKGSQMAKAFNVQQTTISAIKNGKNWNDVPPAIAY
jgi:hypothetical protein